VQSYLKEILDVRGLHIRCIEVKDAPIVGAAIAGLTAFYKPATIVTHPEL
jgi:hypothetical protein